MNFVRKVTFHEQEINQHSDAVNALDLYKKLMKNHFCTENKTMNIQFLHHIDTIIYTFHTELLLKSTHVTK